MASFPLRACLLAAAAALAACQPALDSAPPIVQPGPPGEGSRVITAREASDLTKITYTDADVRFMRDMIGHHAQATEMTELARTRASSEDLRRLAQRIEASQADEIKMMQDWLTARGLALPDPHAHHQPGARMPGMLTAAEMAALAAAEGRTFDRLFLELMIRHHEGALTMVQELFGARGAGQEPDVFAFASDVDADQRMEIDRMLAMLAVLATTK